MQTTIVECQRGVLVCFFVCVAFHGRVSVWLSWALPLSLEILSDFKKKYIPTTPYYYPRLQCASVNSQCHGFQPPPNLWCWAPIVSCSMHTHTHKKRGGGTPSKAFQDLLWSLVMALFPSLSLSEGALYTTAGSWQTKSLAIVNLLRFFNALSV